MQRSTPELEIGVLGPLHATLGGAPLELGGVKPRLVLGLLVAHAGAVVGVDQLVDALWGDEPVATARKTLQVHVSNLRRGLGPDAPIVTERSGYRLDLTGVTVDAVEFELDCRRAPTLPDRDASSLLRAALARWRGLAYADLRHEDAIRPEAARLDELRIGAIEQRIDTDLRLGRHDLLLGELEALTAEHPFRERLRCFQLLALYRSGRQAEALRAYERARRTLADELGLDPGDELRHLQQAILEHSPELAPPCRTRGGPVGDDRAPIPPGEAAPTTTDDGPTGDGPTGDGATAAVRGYEVRELIGRRPDASVYRAYQPSVGREVALRVIPSEVANEPEFVRRFEADCRLLASLDHPHVVSLYDYWRDPTGGYLVMPLLRGGTLAQALADGPLDPVLGVQVVEQVGAALVHAHRHGIVHGDLRPSSVLLDEEGNAYLTDFAPEGRPRGDPSTTTGPVDYTSPERRAGRPVDASSDVWSFGTLVCHVLTGAGPDVAGFTRSVLPDGLLADLRRATDPEPQRRLGSVDDLLRACRRAFGPTTGEGDRCERRARNPYKGLRAFGESDAGDYFGRTALVDELVTRVGEHNLTVVVGPSGCGKSSLVRAGVLPVLRRDGLPGGRPVVVAGMFPGSYPFEELEAAVLHVAVDRPVGLIDALRSDGLVAVADRILPDEATVLVLVVDQFEELFTSTREEAERERFLACLGSAADDERGRVRVVATLRADFFDRPLRHPAFAALVRASTVAVAMPDETSLAEAIIEPARRVGLRLEPELLPTILGDVADEPGALPMLQYALTELTASRLQDVLTVEDYHRTGGVVGALARRAESLFAELAPGEQDAARELFLRLVSVADDREDTRRRVRLTELRGLDVNPGDMDAVLDAFGEYRLLTFDRDAASRGPTVEVAHEALVREWPRLRTWVDDRRDDLRTERRLQAEAAEWRAASQDPSYLVGGVRLRRYEEWVTSTDVHLSADERSFVAAARRLQDQRDRTAVRRRRSVLSAVSLLAVVAALAALVALVQRDRADRKADEATRAAAAEEALRSAAERSAMEDEARALVARLGALPDPDLRLLLALDSHDALAAAGADVEAAAGALYQFTVDHDATVRLTLTQLGAEDRLRLGGTLLPTSLASNGDGSVLVATPMGDSTVSTFDAVTGRRIGSLELATPAFTSTWDATLDLVHTGTTDGRIVTWDPHGEVVATFETSDELVGPIARVDDLVAYRAFRPGSPGTTVTSGPPFAVVVVDPSSGRELLRTTRTMIEHQLSPDGARVVTVDLERRLHVVDLASAEHRTPVGWLEVSSADWSADGRTIWVLDGQQLLPIDTESWGVGAAVPTGVTSADFLDVSPSGAMVVVAGPGAPARIMTLPDGDLVTDVQSAVGPATEWEIASQELEPVAGISVEWLTDRRLAVEHGDTVIWDLASRRAPTAVWDHVPFAPDVGGVVASGGRAMGSSRGDLVVWRPDGTGFRLDGRAVDGDVPAPPAFAADGRTVAVPGPRAVEVRDAVSGEVVVRGPDGYPRPLALSPDGTRLLVATARAPSNDRYQLVLVDATTGEVIRVVAWLTDADLAVVEAAGDTALVAVSERRSGAMEQPTLLWLVDMETGAIVGKGPVQDCIVDLAIEARGERAVAVGCDGTLTLYDLGTIATKEPPPTAVLDRAGDVGGTGTGVAVSPDGQTVVVTRADGRVDGFHVDGDELVPVWSFDVGAHAAGPFIEDGTLWLGVRRPIDLADDVGGLIGVPLDVDELVAFARTIPTRALTEQECVAYSVRGTCATG